MLLSWQTTAVNLGLTCFCLLACFKLAHIFDMVVMTLLQKSSWSHPSLCQQCKGTVQIWLYPLSYTDMVQCPAAEMLIQLRNTLWHLSRKCLGTGWIIWGSAWHNIWLKCDTLGTWEYQGLYQTGPESRRLERKMIIDRGWACSDLGHLRGLFLCRFCLTVIN